jgi:hypothetical protein
MAHRKVNPGDRIAHKSLDDSLGGAKSGVAKEVIDDKESRLIIAEFEGEEIPEGFDQRELVNLGKANRSSGPVLLYPRHFLALLRKWPVSLALVVAFILLIILLSIAGGNDWSDTVTLLGALGVIGFAFAAFAFADAYLRKQK